MWTASIVCLWWSRWVLPPSPVCVYVASTFTDILISKKGSIVNPPFYLLFYVAIMSHGIEVEQCVLRKVIALVPSISSYQYVP